MLKKLVSYALLICLYSCASLNSVSQTTIPAKKGKKVKVEAKNHIFFFLAFTTTWVEELHDELRRKCPRGKIQGILTKNYTKTFFPIIYHQNVVTAEGYCNEVK